MMSRDLRAVLSLSLLALLLLTDADSFLKRYFENCVRGNFFGTLKFGYLVLICKFDLALSHIDNLAVVDCCLDKRGDPSFHLISISFFYKGILQ